jgi:hypothetical protein
MVVGPDTQLVIDGYTRAASTHVVYTFQLAQTDPVRLAHHLHAPAQVIEAVRRGLPTLVLVREPDGTALSQAAREPHVTVGDALLAQARYHERLRPYRDGVVVADFTEVTRDVRPAVERLNDHFGTTFRLPAAEPEPLVAELIRLRPTHWHTLLAFESGLVSKSELTAALADPASGPPAAAADPDQWLPSAARQRQKDALRNELERPELATLRHRARRAYDAFLGHS